MSTINTNSPIPNINFQFFYVAEVAAMLRVSSQVIYQLIHQGKLEAFKFGRAWKIPEDAIANYISLLRSGRHE